MILDLHVHSKYSFDSVLTPSTILKVSKKKGLDGIAITDHNTIQGGLETKKLNKNSNFLVIVGCEIQTEVGDIIGLFLSKDIKSRNSMEVIEEIKEQGGIVVLPHPYKGHTLTNDLLGHIDVIESFNSRTGIHENFCAKKLAQMHNKPVVAGSDAHFASEIGMGITNVGVSSKVGIKNDILYGRINLEGGQSPAYLQSLSQIIKSIKTKHYKHVPVQALTFLIKLVKSGQK